MAFPKGDKKADYLSLYLEVPDDESLPSGWRRHAKFSFTFVNKISEKLSKLRGYWSLCLLSCEHNPLEYTSCHILWFCSEMKYVL